MKNTIKISLLSLVGFLAFGFMTSKSAVEQITIETAIKNKIVSVSFISNGKYSGRSIFCTLKNLSGKAYKIVVPAGSYFQAPNEDEQDLIVPQEEIIALSPNENKSALLNGFCTNLNNRAPKEQGTFKLVTSKTSKKMPKLLTFLKGKKFENHTLQDAIWALTNDSSVSGVAGDDETAVEALRKELYLITTQKVTWYNAPQITTMNEDRTINRETAKISGALEYETKKGAKVHIEVINPDGEVKIKTSDRAMEISGTLSFNFAVEVKGWKKGKYVVRVVEDNKLIKSYDFIV
jgi:hypothetical protein